MVFVKGNVHSSVNLIDIGTIVRVITSWVNGGESLINMWVEMLAVLIAIAISFLVDSEHGQGWGPAEGSHMHYTLDSALVKQNHNCNSNTACYILCICPCKGRPMLTLYLTHVYSTAVRKIKMNTDTVHLFYPCLTNPILMLYTALYPWQIVRQNQHWHSAFLFSPVLPDPVNNFLHCILRYYSWQTKAG